MNAPATITRSVLSPSTVAIIATSGWSDARLSTAYGLVEDVLEGFRGNLSDDQERAFDELRCAMSAIEDADEAVKRRAAA